MNWIPVSERLPESRCNVALVYDGVISIGQYSPVHIDEDYGRFVFYNLADEQKRRYTIFVGVDSKDNEGRNIVTHWYPIPSLPNPHEDSR